MKTLGTAIGAVIMGVCFSTMTVAQARVAMPETSPGSIIQAESIGDGYSMKSGKKKRKKQKVKKNKRGNSKSKRPRGDSSYKVITS